MNSRRGLSSVELLLSAALLAVLLLSGLLAARSATTVAQDSIRTSAAQHRATRALEVLRQMLLPASRASLAALPSGGSVNEPMQDDVGYANLTFRRTMMNGPAGLVLEPDLGSPPYSLEFREPGVAGSDGELLWNDGVSRHPIASGIRELEFRRNGSRITIRITATARGPRSEVHTATGSLVVHNP